MAYQATVLTHQPNEQGNTAMPQYDMSIDPATWPRPDDLKTILRQEVYEASDDYESDVRDWSSGQDVCDCQRDTFAMTDAYERGFHMWLDRQIP